LILHLAIRETALDPDPPAPITFILVAVFLMGEKS
jgi:hypothetical protein